MGDQFELDDLINLTNRLTVTDPVIVPPAPREVSPVIVPPAPREVVPVRYLQVSALDSLLDAYIKYCVEIDKISQHTKYKKGRYPPFPGEITENIVCNYIAKNDPAHGEPIWDKKESGDLLYMGNIIEVKGFSSPGPTSFGPDCSWVKIYFVDAYDFRNKKFKIYEIPLANTDPRFRDIKFTKTQTFGQIAGTGKRPRVDFMTIYNQLTPLGLCNLVFDGYLVELS
jgi:hypothetical protein